MTESAVISLPASAKSSIMEIESEFLGCNVCVSAPEFSTKARSPLIIVPDANRIMLRGVIDKVSCNL